MEINCLLSDKLPKHKIQIPATSLFHRDFAYTKSHTPKWQADSFEIVFVQSNLSTSTHTVFYSIFSWSHTPYSLTPFSSF